MNSPTRGRRKMDSVSIRVPYRHLKQNEVELVGFGFSDQISPESKTSNGVTTSMDSSSSSSPAASSPSATPPSNLKTLILGSMIAAGVQFGWALQLSLLTPYIQTLGIGHAFSSFIWLCGPITGLVVQPCVGIWSDKCHSKYGRRRPFILVGSLMISVAVTIIGFSADIGYILGDTREHCSTYKGTRTAAAIIFVIGFWMLDLANNTVQGPARALLADLSGADQKNLSNAIFASWMALGNILGFSAGASGNWHRWFPFLKTRACCEACGNLKAAFLVAVLYLTLCTLATLYFAKEVPLVDKQANQSTDSAPLLNGRQQHVVEESPVSSGKAGAEKMTVQDPVHLDLKTRGNENEALMDGPGAVLVNILTSVRHLPPAMHSVLTVMALTWLAWFPFFLFDTDWMGREVYDGDPKGSTSEVAAYDKGVREGAFGLLLNSVVLGISSFLIEPMCRQFGSRLVWAASNFMIFICMASTAIISKLSENIQDVIGGSAATRIAALNVH
ncbi:sucrose transport protein SUC3-like isoform X2 [Aristolochia californica]|uniref:sucrose transport protein SUC3-like isoform X2 n=1 Tax=Aristolochia californica TaxID=171875 RepID=UPI0035DC0C10